MEWIPIKTKKKTTTFIFLYLRTIAKWWNVQPNLLLIEILFGIRETFGLKRPSFTGSCGCLFISCHNYYTIHLVNRTFFQLPKGPFFGQKKCLPTESSLKLMRKYFYFVLKALFVLKIFKFLSWLFGYVGKWFDKKAKFNFKI